MCAVEQEVWSSFRRDPRRSEHAALRASDADRDVVHQVLAEAYADGRLDRQEFDARSTDVNAVRTAASRGEIVDRERRRLEKRQREALGDPWEPDDEAGG
jgi:hypothetical protein